MRMKVLVFMIIKFQPIPEGDKSEFFGWMSPGLNKFSNSRSYFSWLSPTKKYSLNSNMNGEERNMYLVENMKKFFQWIFIQHI